MQGAIIWFIIAFEVGQLFLAARDFFILSRAFLLLQVFVTHNSIYLSENLFKNQAKTVAALHFFAIFLRLSAKPSFFLDFFLFLTKMSFIQTRGQIMDNKNIFDLFDLSDIPKDLGDIKNDEFSKELLQLFELAGRELSVDEITVGYYRHFTLGENRAVKTKTQIQNKVYKLSKDISAPIVSVGGKKGIYKLEKIKNTKNIGDKQENIQTNEE